MMRDDHVVGLVANPASARDIRRLVAQGGAVTTNQKLNLISRLLTGLASTGVDRVVSMTDLGGISGGLARLAAGPAGDRWPRLDFVELPLTRTEADTTAAVESMVRSGVRAIAVLGGDGTNRVVAESCGDTPIASISTGTNNAFPRSHEPTVVGIATGLIATSIVPPDAGTYRSKMLTVVHGARRERALVDVAVTDHDVVASGSVWDPGRIHELFLCFAEPHAIGLSSIGAHVRPVRRDATTGLHLRLGRPALARVHAPIAPGLVVDVAISAADDLHPGQAVDVEPRSGVLAIDGERAFRLGKQDRVTVTL
ncbi:MAG: NAD(+)/NADH kinase, partial [Acidimicrobiia bacterium]|nr:NAD(+)/NADH kinase [Acidimicrobiia bacterium]